MDKKVLKLLGLPKHELVQVAIEVRTELGQPSITDVLLDESSTPSEICSDIMHAIKNSVKTNFATVLGR